MTRPATRWRIGALLAVGAYGMHQLRYLVANGDVYTRALAESGHDYLSALEPLIGFALAFVLGQLMWQMVASAPSMRPTRRSTLAWAFAAGLLGVFVGQELIEGQAADGHANGLAGVFGAGGWVAVPLSLVIGAILAVFVRVAEGAAGRLRAGSAPRVRLRPGQVVVQAAGRRFAAPAGVARHLAGRGPPPLLLP